MDVNQKTGWALVTGASAGIGEEFCKPIFYIFTTPSSASLISSISSTYIIRNSIVNSISDSKSNIFYRTT